MVEISVAASQLHLELKHTHTQTNIFFPRKNETLVSTAVGHRWCRLRRNNTFHAPLYINVCVMHAISVPPSSYQTRNNSSIVCISIICYTNRNTHTHTQITRSRIEEKERDISVTLLWRFIFTRCFAYFVCHFTSWSQSILLLSRINVKTQLILHPKSLKEGGKDSKNCFTSVFWFFIFHFVIAGCRVLVVMTVIERMD